MSGSAWTVLLAVLAACALAPRPAVAAPADTAGLPELRRLYLAAVEEERAIPEGMDAIEKIRARGVPPGSPLDATLSAYRGALLTLRAKHGLWPPARLRHLREGLAVLDRTVEAHPDHAEARYLRLMSCYFLPGVLGRGRSVRDDFAALARLLPRARGEYPPELYRSVARFVLERGDLSPGERRRLALTLARADE